MKHNTVCVLPSKDSAKCVFNHLTHQKIRSRLNESEYLFFPLYHLGISAHLLIFHRSLWDWEESILFFGEGRGGEGVGGGFGRTGGEKKKGKQPGKRMWTPRGTEHSGFARFNVDSVKESNYWRSLAISEQCNTLDSSALFVPLLQTWMPLWIMETQEAIRGNSTHLLDSTL